MNPKYLIIEGNIGAGKTTLAKRLSSDLGGILVLEEFADNPFLPAFYTKEGNNAFQLEMSFLASRHKQLSELFKNQNDRLIVADFHFEKSLLFASLNLSEDELKLYRSFFTQLKQSIPDFDLMIYLDADVSQLKKNIIKRGRTYEADISSKYLENIGESYRNLLDKTDPDKVFSVVTSGKDFHKNENDYRHIVKGIKSKLSA